jgi:hypothetical protein
MLSLVMGGPPGSPGVDEERTCTASDGVDDTVPPLPSPCAVAMVHVGQDNNAPPPSRVCVRRTSCVGLGDQQEQVDLHARHTPCAAVFLSRSLLMRPAAANSWGCEASTIQAAEFKPLHGPCICAAQRLLCGSLRARRLFVSSLSRNRLFGQCALPVAKPLPSASVHPLVRQHAWGCRGAQGYCERPRAAWAQCNCMRRL